MDNVKNINHRLEYLDSIRGLAALLVLTSHALIPKIGNNTDFFDNWLDPGKIGVIWFFILSGMVIPFSLSGSGFGALKRFAVQRFFRLYPAYWASLFLFIGCLYLAGSPHPELKNIFANITMVQAALGQKDIVGVYWTLFIELIFYFTCASAFILGILNRAFFREASTYGFLVIALAASAARWWFEIKLPVALPLGLAMMFFGMTWRYASVEGDANSTSAARRILIAITILLTPICVLAYSKNMGYNENETRYISSYYFAIATFLLMTTRFKLSARPLIWLGSISYSLYLIHPSMMVLFEDRGYLGVALTYLTSLALAYVIYRYIETPMNAIGRSVSKSLKSRGEIVSHGS